MSLKPKAVAVLLLAMVTALSTTNDAEATKYGKIMTKAVKKALGPEITPWKKDFKHLACFSYPTDNYGVPTSYEHPRDFICDGWYCLGKEPPAERDLEMDGFVSKGTGGTIVLSNTKKRELALGFILPTIANVIGLDLGLDWDKTVKTNLSFGPAHVRRLRPDPMQEYIRELPPTKKQKVAFTNGDLVLTVLDIVVDHMTVTIEVDRTLNPTLDAQLQDKARDWLGGDGMTGGGAEEGEAEEGQAEEQKDLTVDLKMVNQGNYTITINHPVVVCVWPKRQKAAGVLEARDGDDAWAGWNNLQDPTQVVPVEKPQGD